MHGGCTLAFVLVLLYLFLALTLNFVHLICLLSGCHSQSQASSLYLAFIFAHRLVLFASDVAIVLPTGRQPSFGHTCSIGPIPALSFLLFDFVSLVLRFFCIF